MTLSVETMAWRAKAFEQYFAFSKVRSGLWQRAGHLGAGFCISVVSTRIIKSSEANRNSTCRWFLSGLSILKVRIGLIRVLRNLLVHIGGVFPSRALFILARGDHGSCCNCGNSDPQYFYFIHS